MLDFKMYAATYKKMKEKNRGKRSSLRVGISLNKWG